MVQLRRPIQIIGPTVGREILKGGRQCQAVVILPSTCRKNIFVVRPATDHSKVGTTGAVATPVLVHHPFWIILQHVLKGTTDDILGTGLSIMLAERFCSMY